MKKYPVLLSLFLLVWMSLPVSGFPQQNRGRSAIPVYSSQNDLYILYEREGAVRISLVSPSDTNFFVRSDSPVHDLACHPDMQKGPWGKVWAVWEGIDKTGTHVFLAQVEGDSCGRPVKVSEGYGGTNTSPNLAVDKNGYPWIVWTNHRQDIFRVLIFCLETGQIRQANSSLHVPVQTPRIAIDNGLDVWVFWVSQWQGPGEIIGRRLSGKRWSSEFALNAEPRWPHIDPSVSLDSAGLPWLVWTAYDGEDYEIYYSRWTGLKWTRETPLTDNERFSDLWPSICFLPKNSAIVAWSQVSHGSRICYKTFNNGKWGKIRFLSPSIGFNRKPKITQDGDHMAVVWENTSTEKTQIQLYAAPVLSFDRPLFPSDSSPSLKAKARSPIHQYLSPFLCSDLEETRYSAFGDSITYGVMDRTWFPDKGYVPRLDDLIKSLAEDFHVINRGVPGEMTAEGLARIEQEISTYKAKYQLIMEGTNDMSGGVSSQVAAFNIEEMIIACLQKGVFPLLGTIIPRADSFWDGSIRQNTLLFNDLLRDISSRLKIPLADHYQIFMDYPAGYLSLFSDGAHPNELGYQQIAEAWFESINRIPWPPVNLTVERKINKILFYDESVNNLEWEENPLLAAGTQIARYSIHKKLKEENDSSFVIVATVAGSSLSYLDRDVSSDLVYSYFICAEDESGMKGPPSSTVHDR